MVRPSHRREMAQRSVGERKISIRLACLAFSISRTCYRYQPTLSDENAEIADWLRVLPRSFGHIGKALKQQILLGDTSPHPRIVESLDVVKEI